MRVLAVGDVCGSVGCRYAACVLPKLRREEKIDLTIINGENSADGNGITPQSAEALFACGADVITGGNHTLQRRESHTFLDENPFLLRPENLPVDFGGGYALVDMGRLRVAVWNLMGSAFLERYKVENPFLVADRLLERSHQDGANVILVDFHAEATGEKRALGFYLDGKVSAFFGTHTHVMTSDACVLPKGTGYLTDLGMTGPIDSVLGVVPQAVINRLRDGSTDKFSIVDGPCQLNGCIFEINDTDGRVTAVRPILLREEPT